ncbi:MAG: DNA cytosine methyltransferase [Edaphobacter sp.]
MLTSLSKIDPSPRSPKRATGRQYLSFFSGALGLDLGFEQAGYDCLSLNEIDPVACDTIKFNLNQAFRGRRKPKLYEGDIRDLTADFLRQDLSIESGDLFAIIGGPPCQAFSTAGRRLGLNDDRGNVFLHFMHLVGQLRPKYAVFENVRGLLSAPLVHRPHNERGRSYPPLTSEELPKGALTNILSVLENYGYKTTFNLYNTANFGVPQTRERIIFFASRDGEDVPFLVPSHDEFSRGGRKPWRTLKDAFANLDCTNEEGASFPDRRLKYYRMLHEGQNWRDLPESLQKEAMGKSWYAGGGKTGFYRRLAWQRPSPTLVTSPTMPATDLCHPEELRPLSIQEYAAIQTYPKGFTLAGRVVDKYRQLGNAVPCSFGKAVAEHLSAFDEGRLKSTTTNEIRFSRYAETDHSSWQEGLSNTA